LKLHCILYEKDILYEKELKFSNRLLANKFIKILDNFFTEEIYLVSILYEKNCEEQLCKNVSFFYSLKDRVHCFSMQVVKNKCFFQNTEKKIRADPSCHFREKRKNAHFNSEK